MELKELRVFYEVARAGSVTAGARRLRVGQPAASKALRVLEERAGAVLFRRSKRGMSLTPEGEICLGHAEKIFAEMDRLITRVRGKPGELRGRLRLGASDNLCLYFLPGVLSTWKKLHPALEISLFSGNAEAIAGELREGRIEIGLFYTRVMDRALSLQELGTVPFQGVVSKKHSGKPLRSLPFVGSRPEDYARGVAPVHARLKEKGHSGDALFACNVHEVQKRLVQEGLGFSVFPRLMVEEELKRGSLVAIPSLAWDQPVFLALRARRALSPAAEFARAWFEKRGI